MPYHFSAHQRGRSSGPHNFHRNSAAKRSNRKQYINPAYFVRPAKFATQVIYKPTHNFADFDFNPLLKANLATKGIVTPTPIQDQAIEHGLAGRDVIGIANTGTGKTIAFAMPLLEKLMLSRENRALIMVPTRELAQQIEVECRTLAKGSGLLGAILIGGSSMGPQLYDLRVKPQIVIGTPGRIKDHLERRSLNLSNFNIVVLDEVDRMLDMGFVADMRQILKNVSTVRQSYFFSATVDDKVNELIKGFSKDPVTVSVKTGDTTDTVEQNTVSYKTTSEKIDKLHSLLIQNDISKALVFDDTQHSVERLSKALQSRGFQADAIHGGKSQGQRQRALQRFRSNEINVLVATDVAARGIDVIDISHVINYSLPQSYDDYIHRIGRAGRAGRIGYALTFVEG
ncbi:MAG: DEAD/DEAH box helicase [Candidatus Saccharimonadales bacterium]